MVILNKKMQNVKKYRKKATVDDNLAREKFHKYANYLVAMNGDKQTGCLLSIQLLRLRGTIGVVCNCLQIIKSLRKISKVSNLFNDRSDFPSDFRGHCLGDRDFRRDRVHSMLKTLLYMFSFRYRTIISFYMSIFS